MYNDEKWFGIVLVAVICLLVGCIIACGMYAERMKTQRTSMAIVGARAIVSDIIEARRDWAEEAAE